MVSKNFIIAIIVLIGIIGIYIASKVIYDAKNSYKTVAIDNKEDHQKNINKELSKANGIMYGNKYLQITESDIILGNKDAKVTIFEYASLSCSHCASFHKKIMPELKKQYIDKGLVRFILRLYPLDQKSLEASIYSLCVPKEKYYSFINTLFNKHHYWLYENDSISKFDNLAKLHAINTDNVKKCLKNEQISKIILNNRVNAYKNLNVVSTPTFFISSTSATDKSVGYKLYKGIVPYNSLKEIIDSELESSSIAP